MAPKSLRESGIVRVVLFVVISLSATAAIRGQTTTPVRDDNQVWTEYQVAVPLNESTDFVLIGVLRFGRNVSRPVNERFGFAISRKLGKHLTVTPFFLHVATQPTPSKHGTEERLAIEVTAKFPLGKFTFSDRNRVEFHFPRGGTDFIQYRNRPRLEHPVRLGKFHFEGFIADEVFYDSQASAWIRNRIYIGGERKINSHLTLELYYVRQNDGRSQPGDINALGSVIKVRL